MHDRDGEVLPVEHAPAAASDCIAAGALFVAAVHDRIAESVHLNCVLISKNTESYQSKWKTSSIAAHHSPSLRSGRGDCMGIISAHHSWVVLSAAILAISAA